MIIFWLKHTLVNIVILDCCCCGPRTNSSVVVKYMYVQILADKIVNYRRKSVVLATHILSCIPDFKQYL